MTELFLPYYYYKNILSHIFLGWESTDKPLWIEFSLTDRQTNRRTHTLSFCDPVEQSRAVYNSLEHSRTLYNIIESYNRLKTWWGQNGLSPLELNKPKKI